MAGGLYTRVFSPDGTLLTADLYDGDHQDHVDGNTPSTTDDYSEDVTQMQITTDPGNVGTESLATEYGGELARLRFVVQEIKGYINGGVAVAQWYSTLTPTRVASAVRVSRTSNVSVNSGTETIVSWTTTRYDTASFWSAGSPTRLTAPRNGIYHLGATLEWAGTTLDVNNKYILVYFKKNGGTTETPALSTAFGSTNVSRFMSLNADFQLSSGDYLELAFVQVVANPLLVLTNPTNLSLEMWMSLTGNVG